MNDSLIRFLRERYADEEQMARAAVNLGWNSEPGTGSWASDNGHVWDAQALGPPDAVLEELGITEPRATVVSDEGVPTTEQAAHIAYWDPARVLADIDSKRKILEEVATMLGGDPWQEGAHGLEILSLLVRPYTQHPAFQPEWSVSP